MATAPLSIPQGTDCALVVKDLRDADGAVLDPTGCTITAVARRSPTDSTILAEWSDTPTGTQGTAEVIDAEDLPGEKWVQLLITPAESRAWTWDTARLDVHIVEPVSPYREARISDDDCRLTLRHTTVH